METITKDQNLAHEQKLMMRYAQGYATKNSEKPLAGDVVVEILDAIVSIGSAAVTRNPMAMLAAARQLVKLAVKYGPIVWNMYTNYRERQRRKEKNNDRENLPPTKSKLQKLLAEHEQKEGKGDCAPQKENKMQKLLVANERKNDSNTLIRSGFKKGRGAA